jgi:serine/threonine-protein kinase
VESAPHNLIGRTIAGKFRVEAFLGGGAMGSVYKAQQITLKKTVAIKVMNPTLTAQPAFTARFLREAMAASRIDHPNSMRVLDYGEEPDGLLYIAMEYLPGRDLFTLVKEDGPLPPDRIADIMMQACAALSVAHEMGVVHRDLKPENIMVLDGIDDEGNVADVVKVCDFGIAKLLDERADERPPSTPRSHDEQAKLTAEGLVVGTPEYISPEQASGVLQDTRSDIYSLGVILFELLTGRVPFRADSPVAVMIQHVMEEPPLPHELNPSVDPRLEAICIKAMQKDPDHRYQHVREMRAELRAVHGRSHHPRPVLEVPLQTSSPTLSAVAELELELPMRLVTARIAGFIVLAVVLLIGTLAGARWFMNRSAPPVATHAMPQVSAVVTAPAPPTVVAPPPPRLELASPPPPPPPATTVADLPPIADAAPDAPGADAAAIPTSRRRRDASVASAAPGPPSAPLPPSSITTTTGATVDVYSPAHARVAVEGTRAFGTDFANVVKALDAAQMSQCYATSLAGATTRPQPVRRTMHLTTDDTGHIDAVTLGGAPPMPQAESCILQLLQGRTIEAPPDAGVVTADVDLAFLPE